MRQLTDAPNWLAGGGEMGERIRALDWSKTPLGPTDDWPQSLRSAVSILLPSKAQIVLFWGPDLITLYNDAYRPVFGAKHPHALGLPAREAWSEIWDTGLRDLFEGVLTTGEAFWASDRSFILERYGFPEETFFDVSYDPVRDESGRVGGLFCIVSETTARVISERHLRTLRELSMLSTAEAGSVEDACRGAAQVIAQNPRDLPFALIYLLDPANSAARLAGAAGLENGMAAAPESLDLTTPKPIASQWPLRTALQGRSKPIVVDLISRFGTLPPSVWPESPKQAVVLPVGGQARDRTVGFLVAGVSPRRPLDDQYRGFFELLASQVGTLIQNAKAYEEERRRAETLAELDRAKTAFFSNVSHEFRTPLTLLLGPIEDMLTDDLPPAARERLLLAHRNALRLLKLVNTLLDFSRIEAGRLEASFEPVDLCALTIELSDMFRSLIEREGIRLVVNCSGIAQPVYVDREMWEKILFNLLSNAYKFTYEGEIAVTLRQIGQVAELAVRDTGTGIPTEDLPHLLERFHRVKGAKGRTFEGSGIGLALVDELVKIHGGSVAVESHVGHGSTFTVTIPLGSEHLATDRIRAPRTQASTALYPQVFLEEALRWSPDDTGSVPAETRAPSAQDRQNRHRRLPEENGTQATRDRILIVDDNADMRRYLRKLLKEYEVESVGDGLAALEAARERTPDLVLTDVMMPGMDGFELLRELRQDARLREIPVILLSARAGEEARIEGLEAGADDYLIKPFNGRELLARVRSHLELTKMRREAQASLQQSEEQLRALAENLKEADRRKDEFLAMLAHELRNPLAPIRNAVQILRRKAPPEPGNDWATEVIERQVLQMTRLVDDLLDVSRITRGIVELRKERVDLADIVQNAVEAARPLIEQRGHKLTVSIPESPIRLHVDPTRLAQILLNLLNNAAKYTDVGGKIQLSANLEHDKVCIQVQDNGIGISGDMLPRVFEPFAQMDRSMERSEGGLGIGLTLVERLVALHGGSVLAQSEGPGKGSVFTVLLPLPREDTHEPAAPENTHVSRNGFETAPQAGRILIVDDNRDAADSLAILLRMSGHVVRTVHDGLDALDAATSFEPEIVLLDIGLPRLNGYEVARHIRKLKGGQNTLLVAMTGWGQKEDQRRSHEAGFDHHLTKPVEFSTLMGLLAGHRAREVS